MSSHKPLAVFASEIRVNLPIVISTIVPLGSTVETRPLTLEEAKQLRNDLSIAIELAEKRTG